MNGVDPAAARDAMACSDLEVATAWWFTADERAAIEALDGELPDPWRHSTPYDDGGNR